MKKLPPGLAALKERIEAGTVTHDEYVDMLTAAGVFVGWAPHRGDTLRELRERYPTQEDLNLHLRQVLAQYIDAVPYPHAFSDLQKKN